MLVLEPEVPLQVQGVIDAELGQIKEMHGFIITIIWK